MRLRYYQLKPHGNVLHSLTGLRPHEFEQLVKDTAPLLAASKRERLLKQHPPQERKRELGGGRASTLGIQDQLLLTTMWLRLYPTQQVLAFLFGVTHSTVSRLLPRVIDTLAKAGKDTMRMPDPGRRHRRSFDQLLSELPEFAVVIDSFEQRVQRPQGAEPTNRKDKKEADSWYSGKKKTHTIKSQVGVDLHTGLICDVFKSVRGPTADITLLKASGLLNRLPKGVGSEGDLAYTGIGELHPQGAKFGNTPRRKPRGADKHRARGQDKPRPPEDIEYNKAFAKRRIIVEHTIGRIRQYQALSQTDRNHRHKHTERVQAVAGLVNRKMQSRLPYLFK